jgi:nucleoside-diphosphate-sugar epimerase/alpha-beta hydrolase superfamily lysophospholipase
MRIAVTGAAGDFGTAILRALIEDDRAAEVVGLDLAPLRVGHSKLRAEVRDVRSDRLADAFEGCEAVIHLAFILIPGHEPAEAHSINQDGSKNVLERAAVAGVRRLVVASSLSAHGAPRPGQPVVDDDTEPQLDPDHFYFREKAEVEAMLDRWEADNPGGRPVITRLRPGFVYGPDFANPALALMGAPLTVVPDDGGRTQLVHQDDLARAFCEAAFRDVPGGFLLVTEDSIGHEDLAELSGGRVVRLPRRVIRAALDFAHALRLSPVSGDWAVSGDRLGRPGRAAAALGFEPQLTSRESALVVLAQAGRRLRFADGPPPKHVAERMLEVPTAFVLAARERNAALAALDLDGELERLEHEWIVHDGLRIHLEHHRLDSGAPTFVVAHGLGDHSRRHLGLAAALAGRGCNSLLVDRPGHGLSEGRRGDAPLARDLAVLELAIARARSEYGGPVILLGDSLGGIISWYLLTREPDVDAAICHCIGHPDVHHDRSVALLAPLVRVAARIAPAAPIPVTRLADYEQVALDPETKRYFDERRDRLFNFTITARAAASYLGFRPPTPWERIRIPALVVIGAEDRMVTPEFTRRALDRARPPRADYLELEGAGHQLFLDDLGAAIEPLLDWVERALRPRRAPA